MNLVISFEPMRKTFYLQLDPPPHSPVSSYRRLSRALASLFGTSPVGINVRCDKRGDPCWIEVDCS